MGYNTDFKGVLRFASDLSGKQIAALSKILGEDCRDHPEWDAGDLTHMDLELTDDYEGLKWNESEKTYDLEKKVNVIIRLMRKQWPDFGLTGQLAAQGEDMNDRWALVIGEDGWAQRQEIALTGDVVECPHCGEKFALEGKK